MLYKRISFGLHLTLHLYTLICDMMRKRKFKQHYETIYIKSQID